jgi:hypothetical protein
VARVGERKGETLKHISSRICLPFLDLKVTYLHRQFFPSPLSASSLAFPALHLDLYFFLLFFLSRSGYPTEWERDDFPRHGKGEGKGGQVFVMSPHFLNHTVSPRGSTDMASL